MLAAKLIIECVLDKHHNLELLCRCVRDRAADAGVRLGDSEIKIVLERLIKRRDVGVYQYLAEDDRYATTEYLEQYAYFYWFGPPDSVNENNRVNS